jgi:hypothetical protein
MRPRTPARLALTRGAAGIYNIADDDGAVSIAKARAETRFRPAISVAVTGRRLG